MNSLLKLQVYSESDSEEEKSSQERLPLPNFLANSTKTQPTRETNEEGKIRNFPHEPGNWATYIYIPVESAELIDYINSLIIHFQPLGLKLVDDFHISLTKTIILRHHWISDFTSSIKTNLSGIKPFSIYLCGLKAYVNETRTRSFLSVKVAQGEEELNFVLNRLISCMTDYNLEGFYENTSFHVSLLWCPGDRFREISQKIELLPENLSDFGFSKEVSYCVCATGNKRFSFNFY